MVDLRFQPVDDLREHAGIENVFTSQSVYDAIQVPGGFELVERALPAPFQKNYDEFESPLAWPSELRGTDSVLISAFSRSQRLGGIIVAIAVPGLLTWVNGPGVAVVWDLRVTPAHRRRSVATSLLSGAQAWARERGSSELCAETQNTNVPACRFYMDNGFNLQDVRDDAYPQLPEELQLIWRKGLNDQLVVRHGPAPALRC